MAGGNGTGVTPALVLRLTRGSLRVPRVSLGCCRPRERRRGQSRRGPHSSQGAEASRPQTDLCTQNALHVCCCCWIRAQCANRAPVRNIQFRMCRAIEQRVRVLFAWMCLAVRYGGPATVVCELSVRCRCALACGAALGVRTCGNYARVSRTPAITCTVMSPPLSLCACESHVSKIYASGHARECVSGGG